MHRSSLARIVARMLVASSALSGLPALAPPLPDRLGQDRAPARVEPPVEKPADEKPRPPNRTVPHVDPPTTVLSLSASPTDAELTRARIFAEPLVPMPRGTTAVENSALARAITEYARVAQSDKVAPLLAFLEQYPQSAWRPSLLANLGSVYRAHGYLGKALNAWDLAWVDAKGESELRAKAVADFALGEWLDLSGKVGRADAMVARHDGRVVIDPPMNHRRDRELGVTRSRVFSASRHTQGTSRTERTRCWQAITRCRRGRRWTS